jgi:hypothetical protein
MLNSRQVTEEAARADLSLPLTQEKPFKSLYLYLIVDEPAVELMPIHFLPPASRAQIGEDSLRELAVAAKLEYARNRWLEEVVDHPDSVPGLSSVQRLNDAVLTLIDSRYARVLDGPAAGAFFLVLSNLYARHGLSLTLDSTRSPDPTSSISLDEYVEHAKMRHGPVRAAMDAILLSVGAADDLLERARSSWHNWALGIQFYDDALDIEEDLRNRNLSWTVARTLDLFNGSSDDFDAQSLLDPDAFYEVALTEDVISETLRHAESYFAESARLAGATFPSRTKYQEACVNQPGTCERTTRN